MSTRVSLDVNGNVIEGVDENINSKFAQKNHTHLSKDILDFDEKIDEATDEILTEFQSEFSSAIKGNVGEEANTLEKIYSFIVELQQKSLSFIERIYSKEEKAQFRENIDVFSKEESDERFVQDLEYVHTDENYTTQDKATLTNLKVGKSGFLEVKNCEYDEDGKLVSFMGDEDLHTIFYDEDGNVIKIENSSSVDVYEWNNKRIIRSSTTQK